MSKKRCILIFLISIISLFSCASLENPECIAKFHTHIKKNISLIFKFAHPSCTLDSFSIEDKSSNIVNISYKTISNEDKKMILMFYVDNSYFIKEIFVEEDSGDIEAFATSNTIKDFFTLLPKNDFSDILDKNKDMTTKELLTFFLNREWRDLKNNSKCKSFF